jgi:hypothetical protein
MPADISRVDLLIQYVLLVAGESDEPAERALGPIHLIKYVYLGDLAYARRFQGKTFTEIPWRFHKFGPWSQEANERVQPALLAIGADVRSFPSSFEGKEDWTRWSIRNDDLLQQREKIVPPAIALRLRPEIRRFGKDTSGLLHYVYRTPPMLAAAPGEYLDFSAVAMKGSTSVRTAESPPVGLVSPALSVTPLLRSKSLRDRVLARQRQIGVQKSPRKLINPVSHARYDDVYREGIAWLDELAGEPFPNGERVVQFSDEVWKSSTRKGDDVP